MRHAWIVAGLVLVGGCGQTGALYLPQDDAQSPVVIRPATDGSGPATAPSSTAPPESPTRSTQPATDTTIHESVSPKSSTHARDAWSFGGRPKLPHVAPACVVRKPSSRNGKSSSSCTDVASTLTEWCEPTP